MTVEAGTRLPHAGMSTTVLPSALNVIPALDHSGSKSGSPTILTEIDALYRSLALHLMFSNVGYKRHPPNSKPPSS